MEDISRKAFQSLNDPSIEFIWINDNIIRKSDIKDIQFKRIQK